MTQRVAVLGATGFVGSAVEVALRERDATVVAVRAPRLHELSRVAASEQLFAQLADCAVVVNAAGLPDAVGGDHKTLLAANSELPGLVADVTRRLHQRFVHVSSAAVQGRTDVLDDSPDTHPFSPYSASKACGEHNVLRLNPEATIYRPPGVHDVSRSVTRSLVRLAASRAASVAGDGSRPSAQALLPNVADAIAFLALTPRHLPNIVHHPSEGVTTGSLLADLGGHAPRQISPPMATMLLRVGFTIAAVRPGSVGHVRRAEMLWLGQKQAPSWLTSAGWTPPVGRDGWRQIGDTLRSEKGSR